MSRLIKSTLSGFKTLNVYQKISAAILALTVPLVIALGASALSSTPAEIPTGGTNENVTNVVDKAESDITSSLVGSSSEEVKEDVKIFLSSSSIKEDLEVKILDDKGNMIVGPNFVLNVQSDETNYDKDWDVNDGFLKLTKLTAGDYIVSIEPLEGYIMPEAIEIEVQAAIAYEEKDVSDQVVDESELDASKEDHDFGSNSNAATPQPVVNTVEYVDSSTKVVELKYKPELMADGTIKNSDGTSSGVYAVLDSEGYLTGGYTLAEPTQVAPVSMGYTYVTPKNLTYNLNALNIIGVNIGGEPVENPDESSPAPTETASPTPSPTETASPTPTATASPTPTATASPTPSPTETASPTPTATASPTPTATASPTPSPTPQKIDYKMFNDDGTIANASFKVEEVKVVAYYGWHDLDGARYYFDKNGNKVTGTQIIQSVTYIFDSNGKLQVGSTEVIGLDVSKWQANIDWNAVKASGVDWVIIRAGYRGYGSGDIVEDTRLHSHITGAKAAGLKVGLYFYSQAITLEEAVAEASFSIQKARQYGIDLPIFFDTEATGTGAGRADYLSTDHRTEIAKAFCETVENSGYQAGVYASKSWFYYQLHYSQISQYDIWLAHYTSATDFKYKYDIWQYTGTGSWPGVGGLVDINIGYKPY